MENYVDFAVQKAVELLAIDSPTGYTAEAEEFVLREFRALGFAAERTAKGGILIDLGGESTDDALLLEAQDRKSTRLNSSHRSLSRMPSSA